MRRGFTLIELLIYIGLLAVFLPLTMSFFIWVLQWGSRTKDAAIIDEQGARAIQQLTQAIRNADSIQSPAVGSRSSRLVLRMVDAAQDPTTVNVVGGWLGISEGSGSAVPLTDRVLVSVGSQDFYNRSQGNTPGSITFSFRINRKGIIRTFTGGASLRPHTSL